MIAKKIGCDRRTVAKMLKVGTRLKIIKCKNIKLGKRTYQACMLNPKFKRLLR